MSNDINEEAEAAPATPIQLLTLRDSEEFMRNDMKRSLLTPEQIGAYSPNMPIAKSPWRERDPNGTTVSMVAAYEMTWWDSSRGKVYRQFRVNRDENKYVGEKGITPPVEFLAKDTPYQKARDKFKAAKLKAIIEGKKKSVAAVIALDIPVACTNGCWGAIDGASSGGDGGLRSELMECINPGDTVILGVDGDWATNTDVAKALGQQAHEVQRLGATPILPDFGFADGKRLGMDDWLATFLKMEELGADPDMVQLRLKRLNRVPLAELEPTGTWIRSSAHAYMRANPNHNDQGAAAKLVSILGLPNVRYDPALKKWALWMMDPDAGKFRWRLFSKFPDEIYTEVTLFYDRRSGIYWSNFYNLCKEKGVDPKTFDPKLKGSDDALRSAHADASTTSKWAKDLGEAPRRARVIDIMTSQSDLHVSLDKDFDQGALLLGVQNGVLDFNADGELLREETQEDRILNRCDASYPPDGKRPTGPLADKVDKFLSDVFSAPEQGGRFVVAPARERLAQLWLGGSLTGVSTGALMLPGVGANGKSAFSKLTRKTVGTYGKDIDIEMYVEKPQMKEKTAGGPDASLMGMRKKRLFFAKEFPANRFLNTAAYKRIHGGEGETMRGLYMPDQIETELIGSTIMTTNHKPKLRSTSVADIRRLTLIPMLRSYKDNEGSLAAAGVDMSHMEPGSRWFIDQMSEKGECRDFMLWWMVEGTKAWIKAGSKIEAKDVPKDIADAFLAYISQEDRIAAWMEWAGLEVTGKDEDKVGRKQVFESYKHYLVFEEDQRITPKASDFYTTLEERFGARIWIKKLDGFPVYRGLKANRPLDDFSKPAPSSTEDSKKPSKF